MIVLPEKREILLPKGHLSFSQITLWLSAKETYRKKYYPDHRPPFTQSPEMAFGNFITEEMEKGNPLFDFIPRYDTFEFPQVINQETGKRENATEFNVDGVIVEAYIDQLWMEKVKFREQKTGRTPWTQSKVNKHIQMDLYSMLLEMHFGFVDEECDLIWVPARKKMKTVELAGGHTVTSESSEIEVVGPCEEFPLGYVSFPRRISSEERKAIRELVVRVAHEIDEDYRAMRHLYN